MAAATAFFAAVQLGHLAYMTRKGALPFSGYFLLVPFLSFSAMICYGTGGFFSTALMLLFFIPLFAQVFQAEMVRYGYYAVTALVFFTFYLGPLLGIQTAASPAVVNVSTHRGYLFFVILGCMIWGIGSGFRINRQMHKQLELAVRAREELTEDARKAVKVKDQFLANMSHEIRNPMNGIIGMMHVLLDSDLDEEQRHYSNIVYNSARALLTIVNDILDLSKIEAGKLELDNRDFDLEIAVKDIVSLPQLQARQKGIDFTYNIDSNVPCLLEGDIGRIRQVLNNLTGNAIKFTDSGEVSLAVTLVEDHADFAVLRFDIEDTGIGIPEEKIDSLFTAFTQADLSITKRFGGTGLGLSISKLLVEKMGGQMGAQSVEMIGSTFWFTLSLKKQKTPEYTEDRTPTSRLMDCRVLVLSDGASLGLNFERNLEVLSINYEQAFDETEAMEMLKWSYDEDQPFELVIMEAKEFEGAAESFGRKIKENSTVRDVRMMLLTSIGKKGDAKRFEEIGFSAYLSKPVEKDLLKDAMKTVLARPLDDGNRRLPIITRYSILERKKHQNSVLIVDDIETNRITARAMISKQGFKIEEAANGVEAVEKYQQGHFDLILMDCQMPEMDGFEATRQIRKLEAEKVSTRVPIVAMTGNAFESDRQKCREAGMDDFIAKPVDPELLSKIIRSNLIDTIQLLNEFSVDAATAEDETDMDDSVQIPENVLQEEDSGVPVFDREKLLERFGGDQELAELVLDSFFSEARELLDDLAGIIDGTDMDAVRSKAHALKGSCANVNAERMRSLALELETDARAEQGDLFSEKLATLEKEYEIFIREAGND